MVKVAFEGEGDSRSVNRYLTKKRNRLALRGWAAVIVLFSAMVPVTADPLDDLAAAIEHDLENRCVGFGYAIFEGGLLVRSGGGGSAVIGDPENQFDFGVPFDENTVKDAHSMSKTITSVAMLLAIDSNPNVDLDSAIVPYLPSQIEAVVPGDSPLRNVTFRQILGHRSGIGASSSFSWSQIRSQLAGGMVNDLGDYEYANWNYAVCRLLIPYVADFEFFTSLEDQVGNGPAGVSQQDWATANFYINWVRNNVFEPAGLGTIHPRPVNSTLPIFARYYDFTDLGKASGIMPDRRRTVGSGGWAMSARQYAQFIDALFDGEIIPLDRLQELVDGQLGIFRRTGADGSAVYVNHNGSFSSSAGGGESSWIYFPNDISVAIQVNSRENHYDGAGINLGRIIQEAWENHFGAVSASSLTYPLHLFFSRQVDGWITSRGITSGAGMGARNFDYDWAKDSAPVGFEHHLFFGVGSQAFLLRYDESNFLGNGSAVMHRINTDGTLGAQVFSSDSWLGGWDHLRAFGTPQGTFLLLHNKETGRVRTVPVSALGNVLSAVSDLDLSTGFDVGEIITLNGQNQFIRYNSSTGEVVARALNSDGTVGGIVYSSDWAVGFNDWEIYEAGGNDYIFRYDTSTGAARINRVDGSLENTPQMLASNWAANWTTLRFFEIGNQAYFIRYNKENGEVRIQEVDNDGTPGEMITETRWMRPKKSTSAFDPARGGWDDLQVYDATPGFTDPSQQLAGFPSVQTTIELGDTIGTTIDPASLTEAVINSPQARIGHVRGEIRVDWTTDENRLYYLQESHDLKTWRVSGVYEGGGSDLSFAVIPDPATGELPDATFYRFRVFESVPVDPAGGL
jgi:CubicO group peptidase (beta-lactamase class C family)